MTIAKRAIRTKLTSKSTGNGRQNLLSRLKKLGTRELVFADPSDSILGIGFSVQEADEASREN